MSWIFEEYNENSKRRDPYGDKFFENQNQFDSLVRESIQNSLDAVDNQDQPVRVLFDIKLIDLHYCDSLQFSQLNNHLKASQINCMPFTKQTPFITIEDFNTKGLEGKNKEDFLRKENITSKDKGGGSHGIGKIVFNAVSPIRTFYAYSEFSADENLFEGISTLKSHNLNGQEYRPDGSINIEVNDIFVKKTFKRTKGIKGLSIAIPYSNKDTLMIFDEDLKIIRESIVRHFYMSILENKLIAEVDGRVIDAQSIQNNQSSLYRQCENENKITHQISKKDWQAKNNSSCLKNLSSIINERLATQNQVSIFNFEIKIQLPDDNKQTYGELRVLIQKNNQSEDKGVIDFWRDDLLINEANTLSSPRGFIGLVLIKNNELSSLLRLTEDPGHTKWQIRGKRADELSDYGTKQDIQSLIKYIKNLPHDLIRLIENKSSQLDKHYLSKYFPKSSNSSSDNQQSDDLKNPMYKARWEDINPPEFPDFNYQGLKNGFALTLKNKLDHPRTVTITMAYGTNGGDAFKNYSKEDFILGEDILLETRSCRQLAYDNSSPNSIKYEIMDPNFRASFQGFDNERELKIDVQLRDEKN